MNLKYISFCKFCRRCFWPPRFLIKLVFIILILKSIYHFDPFGLSSISASYSKTLFYQWTTSLHKADRDVQNPVSVVILRDESFKGDWPVKAIIHAEVLEEIATFKPKAIFFDFAFIDRRDDDTLDAELVPAINNYTKHNKIYFLGITPDQDACELRIFKGGNIDDEITLFKKKFKFKKNDCAVLIASSEGEPNRVVIAGYNDKNEFISTGFFPKLPLRDDGELLGWLWKRADSISRVKALVSQYVKLNLDEASYTLKNGLCLLQHKPENNMNQLEVDEEDRCDVLISPSVKNIDHWEISTFNKNNKKTNEIYYIHDKKLSMALKNAYLTEFEIIYLASKKNFKTLEGNVLGILPELIADKGAILVSGPQEDMEFPGLKYTVTSTWPFSTGVLKPPAVAFKIFNDFHPNSRLNESLDEDMELVWNSNLKEGNNGPYKCINLCEHIVLKIFKRISPDFLKNFIAEEFGFQCLLNDSRQQCPPIPTLDAHFLLNGTDESKTDVETLIKDKYVFYGGDLDAINDLVYPPTHNEIPGVYFNAMALDNLLMYKENFIRHSSLDKKSSENTRSTRYWLEFFGLIGLVVITEGARKISSYDAQICPIKNDKKQKKEIYSLKRAVGVFFNELFLFSIYLLVSLLFLGGLAWYGFFVRHVAPIDFLGLGGLIGLRSIPRLSLYYEQIKRNGIKFILNLFSS